MKKTKESYNILTDKLTNIQPVFEAPEELTRQIMEKIAHIPQYPIQYRNIRLIKTVSGIASLMLISLLILEIMRPQAVPLTKITPTVLFQKTDFKPIPLSYQDKVDLFFSYQKIRAKESERLNNYIAFIKNN